jgi:hypothetical protein
MDGVEGATAAPAAGLASAQTPASRLGSLTDEWAEYSEGVIPANLEHVQAQHVTGRANLSANDPEAHYDRWDTLLLLLRSTGFASDSTHAWQGFGFDRVAGRGSTLELLEHSARKGRLFLGAVQSLEK